MGEFLTACEESKRSMRESQRSEAFSVLESNLEVLGHVDSGVPVQGTETKGWELRRVHTYDVDHYGEKPPGISTLRPFYKDYRHYKHYGQNSIIHLGLLISRTFRLPAFPQIPELFLVFLFCAWCFASARACLSRSCRFLYGSSLMLSVPDTPYHRRRLRRKRGQDILGLQPKAHAHVSPTWRRAPREGPSQILRGRC
jgi:hypothetical protein